MADSSDEDVPTLSADTLKALNEFYKEQEEIINNSHSCGKNGSSDLSFQENWQLSQFWYDASTIETLCKEICRITDDNGKIALISCPSLYTTLKNMGGHREVLLFEFDKRFSKYGPDYHYYDYNFPLNVPREFSSSFDVVIADPPFLSEDCITKTAITIKLFAKSKIILCTGAVMKELVGRLLNVKKSEFDPKHQNNLANEFYCYTNYDCSFK